MDLKVAIVGSRDWKYHKEVEKAVLSLPRGSVVVSGGARGVDTYAENFARKHGYEVEIYPADWDRHGKSAGYIRNKDIVAAADRLIAFQQNQSRGTQNSIDLAMKRGIPVKVVTYKQGEGLKSSAYNGYN